MTHWIEDGSPASPIWLVGEAPGDTEVALGRPFRGASGVELDRMLAEVGIARHECFATNVCHIQPPPYTNAHGKVIRNDIDQFFLTKTAAAKRGVGRHLGRYPLEPIVEGLRHLNALLARHRPTLIIALGNTPLWSLTGHSGITKWRGSVFDPVDDEVEGDELIRAPRPKIICTFHPADVLRTWEHRPLVVQDFRRALRESTHRDVRKPTWNFLVSTSPSEVRDWLTWAASHRRPLVCDTEGWGRVDCIGFACSSTDAVCIPFKHETTPSNASGVPEHPDELHYWSFDDELRVTSLVRQFLVTNPIVFHNALWDIQVIARRWACLPRLHSDTQVLQHVCFPGLLGGKIDPVSGKVDKKGSSLSLSFIASMYCDYYRYWKDDGRLFDPAIGDERDYWRYNCEDCVRTYECLTVLDSIVDRLGLREQCNLLLAEFGPVFKMMFRGIRFDRDAAAHGRKAVLAAKADAHAWIQTAVGHAFNPDSNGVNGQMQRLFYDDLRQPKHFNRKTKSPSLDDTALESIARKQPLLRPLVTQIQNYRTLDTVKGDLDPDIVSKTDARLRTALNVAYVETMRFSSNETAFGEGGNIQNIKRPDDD